MFNKINCVREKKRNETKQNKTKTKREERKKERIRSQCSAPTETERESITAFYL